MNLAGKVALITGSGRGIGLAIAEGLADCGASVAIHDIDLAIAGAAADRINHRGGTAAAFAGDIRDLTLPERLVREVAGHFKSLHFLFNNASIQSSQPWLELNVATMQAELSANVISPMLFCQAAAPIFKQQHFGRIINLGSIQQVTGNANMLSYSIGKAAIEKLTTALARDLAKDNVTVNCIAPGWIASTLRNEHDFRDDQEKIEAGKKKIPLGRIGEPSDCVGVAVLLCSEAGEYITGQSIYVTGGMGL